MELSEILNAITTVGFPIVMCIGLAWYVKSSQQAYREDVKSMVQSIDNNTAVINRLLDKLDMEEK